MSVFMFCRSNQCGGCNRLWYTHGQDVTKHCGMYNLFYIYGVVVVVIVW